MQNDIKIFEHSEFGELEVLTIDGKPYFPASECAKTLGYAKPFNAVERHCRYTLKRGIPHPQSPDKLIEIAFIPEGDLYRLIIRSKLPGAEKFERWVFDIVLPTIRKHGAYITDDVLDQLIDNPESAVKLFEKLKDDRTQRAALEGQVEMLTPKARYYDIILQCPGAVLATVIAKDYGMTAVRFNRLLHALGVQFRYKTNRTWLLYHEHDGKGYTITNTYFKGSNVYIHMCWTQKGRRFIYDFLAGYGILPQVEMMIDEGAVS
jgi:prophage antirepressor-like protein